MRPAGGDLPLFSIRLAAARAERDLSRDEVAAHLRALSREIDGIDAAASELTVRRWEQHGRRPQPRYRRLLCRLYDRTPEQLGFSGVAPEQVSPAAEVRDDEEVRRRRFLELGLATTLGVVEQRADGARRAMDFLLNREPVGSDIDEWERTAYAYGCELASSEPARLLANSIGDFDEVVALAQRMRPGSARRRLVHVAAQLAYLIAQTLMGQGEHQTARKWWRIARNASESTGDPVLAAVIRGHQAMTALYGDYTPEHVIALSEETEHVARGVSSPGLAEGIGARAQALAHLGRHREARDALTQLSRTFDQLPDTVTGERASAVHGWQEHRLRHIESYTHTQLGDRARAEVAQERALALYQSPRWRGPAQVRLHRAACLVADGDVVDGIRYASSVLQALPEDRRRDGFISPLARAPIAHVPRNLHHLPDVGEYRELIAAGHESSGI